MTDTAALPRTTQHRTGLALRGLTVTYPTGQVALDHLDLDVDPGRAVGLIGSSGSGKTTATRAILGLLPADTTAVGTVELDGQDLWSLSTRELRRLRWERIALVPQAAMNALDPVHKVDQQIAEVVRAHRRTSHRTALDMAHAALEAVGISRDRASSYPHQFSGGMRQRASIAMATVLEPQVLIADEPTTGLDVVVQDRILELLHDARTRFGLSLLVVTHDLGVANELCDDMVVLEHGRTIASGTTHDVLEGQQRHSGRPETAVKPAHSPMVEATEQSPALETSDLTVTYQSGRGLASLQSGNELTALDQVNLDVHRGEIVGLAGESGCGKSSLISTLVGLQRVSSGTIRIGGAEVDLARDGGWATLRGRVQMIFQDPYDSLNPRLTVRETVLEPLAAQRIATGENARDRIYTALENAGLTPPEKFLDRLPHQLSGGERQRIAIARALVVEPDIILADEPVSMLDEHTAEGVVTVLLDLAHRLDVAVLLVSHDVSLLRRVCDRVAIMYLGRLVEVGATEEVLRSPRHPYTNALVSAVPSRVPGVRRPRVLLEGEAPSLAKRPSGCSFHPRCPQATDRCVSDEPTLLPVPSAAHPNPEADLHQHHTSACWHPLSEVTPSAAPAAPRGTQSR